MKKVTLGLTVVASFVCTDIFADAPKISEQPKQSQKLTESTSSNIVSKVENHNEISNCNELQNQVKELSNRNFALEKENSSLQSQIQKLQDNAWNNDNENKRLSIKLLHLEQEKEELLQKLFEHQMNVQEVKEVSFELNSLLNQIPAEDETTKDCIKLLQDLTDMDNRIKQLISSTEIIELNSDKSHKIEELIKELKTMQELVQKKVEFYKNHEQKLTTLCNKKKTELPKQLEQTRTQLTQELKKYPELSNIKLEENLMNNIKTIKTFRKNKSAEQADKIKSLEKTLNEYVKLKIKETDLRRLETKTRTFSDNIEKIEVMIADFIKKNERLEFLKNEALKTIENAKIANDNQAKEKN